ncbi:MAG TPA: methyltransferase domain-containing protein [Nocardioides sp.]|jgi:protein-L-isoaspartate(D-aspartate) O-methyltransferase
MDRVRAAFDATPRGQFLPEAVRRRARFDGPLDIGHHQTNSQPRTVADMLRLLDVQPGHSVLDVGSGSGWTTALLAHLVGEHGRVRGVEVVPELVTTGRANLERVGRPWASIEQAAPDVLGLPDHAPYDRILVSAEARRLPQELVDQLTDDGVLVVPVAGWMQRVTMPGPTVTEHGAYRFVPLV